MKWYYILALVGVPLSALLTVLLKWCKCIYEKRHRKNGLIFKGPIYVKGQCGNKQRDWTKKELEEQNNKNGRNDERPRN